MKEQTVRITATSIEEAKKQAAEKLNVDIESIEYNLISQVSAGFFSFLSGKKVEIEAWTSKSSKPRKPKKTHQPRRQTTPVAEEPKEPMSEELVKELIDDLALFCKELCSKVCEEPVSVSSSLEGEKLIFNIESDAFTEITTKNTRVCEAIEHLVRKKPKHLKRELPFRIFVDAGSIRKQREVELMDIAKEMSEKVCRENKPIVLNYKSPYDRRVIHKALDQDDSVYTKSIGKGSGRKLMILPARQ